MNPAPNHIYSYEQTAYSRDAIAVYILIDETEKTATYRPLNRIRKAVRMNKATGRIIGYGYGYRLEDGQTPESLIEQDRQLRAAHEAKIDDYLAQRKQALKNATEFYDKKNFTPELIDADLQVFCVKVESDTHKALVIVGYIEDTDGEIKEDGNVEKLTGYSRSNCIYRSTKYDHRGWATPSLTRIFAATPDEVVKKTVISLLVDYEIV